MDNPPVIASARKRQPSLTSRTMIGFLWQLSNRLVEVGGRVLVMLILARLLTPSAFGIASAALLVASLGQTFTQLGVVPALVQRGHLSSAHIGSATICTLLMGITGFGAIWLSADAVAAFFRMPELGDVTRAISLVFPISAASRVPEALMMREMAFRKLASIDMASFVVGYAAVGIYLAWAGLGFWAIIFAQLGQILIKTILIITLSKSRWSLRFSRTALWELLHYGLGHTLSELGNVAALQGDNIIVGRVLGPASLGLYGRAYALLAQPAALVGTVFDRVLFPAMSQVREDEKGRIIRAQLRASAGVALVMMPMSFLLVVLAPEVIIILLGSPWTDATVPFQILGATMLFRSTYKINDSVARARGAIYGRAMRQWLYATFVIIGSIVGSFWGLVGVSIGVAFAVFLNYAMMLQLSLAVTGGKIVDIARMYVSVTLCLFPSAISSTITMIILRHNSAHPLSIVFSTVSIALSVEIVSILFMSKLFGPEVQWAVSILRAKLPSPIRRLL